MSLARTTPRLNRVADTCLTSLKGMRLQPGQQWQRLVILPTQLGKEVSALIAQPMVRAHPNNGSRRAFQYGDMQQMRRPAFDRRPLIETCVRTRSARNAVLT